MDSRSASLLMISPMVSSPNPHGPSLSTWQNRQQIRSLEVSAPGSMAVAGATKRLSASCTEECWGETFFLALFPIGRENRFEEDRNVVVVELFVAAVERPGAGAFPRSGPGELAVRHLGEGVRGVSAEPFEDEVDRFALAGVEHTGVAVDV